MRLHPVRPPLALSLAALLLPLVASCSSTDGDRLPTHPVSGSVTVGEDPAEGALVVFHPRGGDPGGPRPRGRVQADGSFRLGTYEEADGAPAGDYVVTVLWAEPPEGPMADPDMGPDRLRGRFSSPQRSELSATITEGENQLQSFRLSR